MSICSLPLTFDIPFSFLQRGLDYQAAKSCHLWSSVPGIIFLLTTKIRFSNFINLFIERLSWKKSWILFVSWEYSCYEEYLEEFIKGKMLKYSLLQVVLPRNRLETSKPSMIKKDLNFQNELERELKSETPARPKLRFPLVSTTPEPQTIGVR